SPVRGGPSEGRRHSARKTLRLARWMDVCRRFRAAPDGSPGHFGDVRRVRGPMARAGYRNESAGSGGLRSDMATALRLWEIVSELDTIGERIMEAGGEITPELEAELDAMSGAFDEK